MSAQKRQRRSYTPEYRIEAANLVIDTGRSIAAVAKEIGVGEQILGNWVKAEKDRRRGDGEPTGPLNEDERAELARLRRENFDLKQDNEFRGKAAAQLPRRSLETREIRTDGFGEGSLRDSPDGQAPRGDEIWVLRMEEASADRTIETCQSATEPGWARRRDPRGL